MPKMDKRRRETMLRATRAAYSAGYTLVEMLIVIAIIGTLTGMLLPSMMDAMESGRTADCSNNLHNIGIALKSLQNRNRVPRVVPSGNSNATFVSVMLPALGGSDKALRCPSNLNDDATETSYGFHVRLHRWGDEDNRAVLALDYGDRVVNPYVMQSGGEETRNERFIPGEDFRDSEVGLLRPRHRRSCNVLMGDLHVEKIHSDFVLFPEVDPEAITPGQVAKIEKEFPGETIDIDELSADQTEFLERLLFRQRWLYLREGHLLNEEDVWTGEDIPTFAPDESEESDG